MIDCDVFPLEPRAIQSRSDLASIFLSVGKLLPSCMRFARTSDNSRLRCVLDSRIRREAIPLWRAGRSPEECSAIALNRPNDRYLSADLLTEPLGMVRSLVVATVGKCDEPTTGQFATM